MTAIAEPPADPCAAETTLPPTAGRTGEARRWDVVRRLASTYGYRCDDAGREMWAVLRTARA